MSDPNQLPDPRELIGSDAPARVPCGLVHDLLPAAVGGDLESETEAVLSRHVRECVQCAREWRALRESQEALRSLVEGGHADPGFDDAFFADLHEGIVGAVRHRSRVAHDTELLRGRRRTGASWLPIVGTLAATLVVGFFVGKGLDTFGGPPAPATGPVATQSASQGRVDWDLIADSEFTPYLVEAIQRFAERRASSARLDPVVGVAIPIADPSRGPGSHETDF